MKKLFGGAPIKGAFIHGALLLVMLVYGYKVWTRDKTAAGPTSGSVVMWNKPESDLVAIEYSAPNRTVKIERKGDGAGSYWWGSETKETPPPAPPPAPMPNPDPGPGSGSAGPAKPGPGSATKPPTTKPPTTKPPATGSGAEAGSAVKPPTTKPPTTKPPTTKPPTTKPPAPATGSAGSAGPAKWGPGSGSAGSGSGGTTGSGSGATAGSGSSAGSAAGSGGGSSSPPDFDPISGGPTDQPAPITTTREFPVGDGAEKVIKAVTSARALADLGKLTDELKKEYKLEDTSITLSIVFKSGTKSFVIGGSVYGGSDKYALDTDTGKGYVLSGSFMLQPLEQGESGLRLGDPKGFPADSVARVTASSGGKAKTALRMMADAAAKPDPANPHAPVAPTGKTKTWGDPATGKPDQTLANFIDNIDKLKPTKYESELDAATLTEVVKLTYQDGKGSTLGTMTLYKRDKPAEGPIPATVEYYIMTEKTRVPGVVPKSMAERVDQDIATVFPQ
jgi:hypothetical protein